MAEPTSVTSQSATVQPVAAQPQAVQPVVPQSLPVTVAVVPPLPSFTQAVDYIKKIDFSAFFNAPAASLTPSPILSITPQSQGLNGTTPTLPAKPNAEPAKVASNADRWKDVKDGMNVRDLSPENRRYVQSALSAKYPDYAAAHGTPDGLIGPVTTSYLNKAQITTESGNITKNRFMDFVTEYAQKHPEKAAAPAVNQPTPTKPSTGGAAVPNDGKNPPPLDGVKPEDLSELSAKRVQRALVDQKLLPRAVDGTVGDNTVDSMNKGGLLDKNGKMVGSKVGSIDKGLKDGVDPRTLTDEAQVKKLQTFLVQKGLLKDAVDGVMGDKTLKALKESDLLKPNGTIDGAKITAIDMKQGRPITICTTSNDPQDNCPEDKPKVPAKTPAQPPLPNSPTQGR